MITSDQAPGAGGTGRSIEPVPADLVRSALRAPDVHERGEELGLERVIFLSDGVFAIAMTLLVLDVRLPDLPANIAPDRFADALSALALPVLAYALSFAVLGTLWVAHWRRFRTIERVDPRLVWINLLLLALVAFMPFPTSVIGRHGDQPLAVVLYASTLAALSGTGAWFYAARHDLLVPGSPRDLRDAGVLRALVVPAVMLGSLLLLPFVDAYAVEWSWLLILPLLVLVRRRPAAEAGGSEAA